MTQEEEFEEVLVENLSPEELVEYARYGEVAIIKELANQGLNTRLDTAVDERGNTMLHMFAANGYLDCIEEILRSATNPTDLLNRPNKEGNVPLHWACVAGQLEAVKLLMAHGAIVAIENTAGRTPVCEAHQHKRTSILEHFEEKLGRKDAEEATITVTAEDMGKMAISEQEAEL